MSERVDGTAANPEKRTPSNLQFRDLLEAALFYLGIPGITLYPIGVLFYWIQIRTHYDISADAAWQAVFKIPNEILIAETVSLFVKGFVAATPHLLITGALTYIPITIGWQRAWGTEWRANPFRRLLTLLALIYVVVWLVFNINFTVSALQGDPLSRARAVYHLFTIAAALLAGYLLAVDHKRNRQSPNLATASIFVRRWALRGALVAYTSVYIGIFILGTAIPIPLPTIKFGEDSQREGGVLLGDPATTGGYWYYIDPTGRVVALPSDEATDVVVADD